MADGTGLRGSLSLQPHMIADLFARPASAFAAPVVIERITVGIPVSRKDANGAKFVSYPISAHCADGPPLRTERRYTEFAALHEQIQVALGLPVTFPVPATPAPLAWLSGEQRDILLQDYLNSVVAAARSQPLPTLAAFCRMPPYVAVGTSAEACLASLPTATMSQSLAMLRAHPRDDAITSVGTQRLLALAQSSDATTVRLCVDAGAVEWLCAHLRKSTTVAKPSSTLVHALGSHALGLYPATSPPAPPPGASPALVRRASDPGGGGGGGGGGAILRRRGSDEGQTPTTAPPPSARLHSLRTELSHRNGLSSSRSSALGAGGKFSSFDAPVRSAADQTAVDIVATLAALDENPHLLPSSARQVRDRHRSPLVADGHGAPWLRATNLPLMMATHRKTCESHVLTTDCRWVPLSATGCRTFPYS
jgi:hypothetical protein